MKKGRALESVGVCVHATGAYLDYAQRLRHSLQSYLFPEQAVHLYVFTDRIEEVKEWTPCDRICITPVPVPHRPWPDSTILRFRDYVAHQNEIHGDLLIFLDADMELRDYVGPGLLPYSWPNGLALVRHPGFFEPDERARRGIFRRAARGFRARGSWETSKSSLAFVEEGQRKIYVCGGVWMGLREQALGLCALLADRIDADAANGVVAVWHDESHLNWWASSHVSEVLTPEYCFVDGYANLTGLRARIVALEKPQEFVLAVKG